MSKLIVEPARAGAKGVDTVLHLTQSQCELLLAAGYSFAVQYLGPLTVATRDAILAARMALQAVTYSRRPGWMPSAALGAQDGTLDVQHARSAGLPEGMTLWIDFEGPSASAAPSDCINWVNARAHRIIGAGYKAGLYVGYGIQLTAAQLYRDLAVTGYWHSCSHVQDVAIRGYQMIQEEPGNQHICGMLVDVDTIQLDRLGNTPNWLTLGSDGY